MSDQDASAARSFHDATKLSYINLSTKPALYKDYSGLSSLPLPEPAAPDMPVLRALEPGAEAPARPLDLDGVAQLLYYSAGLIRKSYLRSAGEVHYRAAASAGALYPIELYLVCGDLPGLAAGVYHFAPARNALTQLRQGDFRGNLVEAAGGDVLGSAPAVIATTSVFWRSAWKYRERGYRYCFWDNGTIVANLLAVARSQGLNAKVVVGFADGPVDRLLGVDSEREAATCLIPLGEGFPAPPAQPFTGLEPGELGDAHRLVYPESLRLHQDSCLTDAGEVASWRASGDGPDRDGAVTGPLTALELSAAAEPGPLGAAITQRGSTRRFDRRDITFSQFSGLLEAVAHPFPADYRVGDRPLLDTYLIANAVDGVSPGAYFLSPGNGLELLREGEMREEAGHLCFEQALGADASVVAFFMADLDAILGRWGNRGYRLAQLEAGVMGGNMYLASHSLGLGATGMTFFDAAVTAFFSPHAAGKSLMFLVGLGATGTPNQVRPFRSKIGVLKDSLARGAGGPGRPVPDWLYS